MKHLQDLSVFYTTECESTTVSKKKKSENFVSAHFYQLLCSSSFLSFHINVYSIHLLVSFPDQK